MSIAHLPATLDATLGCSTNLFYLLTHVSGKKAKLLLDSGAQRNFLGSSFAKRAKLRRKRTSDQLQVKMANGSSDTSTHIVGPAICKSSGWEFEATFQVLPLEHDGILGMPWFRKVNPVIDWNTNTCSIQSQGKRIILSTSPISSELSAPESNSNVPAQIFLIQVEKERSSDLDCQLDEKAKVEGFVSTQCHSIVGNGSPGQRSCLKNECSRINDNLSTSNGTHNSATAGKGKERTTCNSKQLRKLDATKKSELDLFSQKEWADVICNKPEVDKVLYTLNSVTISERKQTISENTDDVVRASEIVNEFECVFQKELPLQQIPKDRLKHGIELIEGAKPYCEPLRPMSTHELKATREKIKEYLEKNWIEPSNSEFGSQVLFALKSDKSLRFCVDYRGLNKITKKSKYPLPRFDEVLERVNGATWFSKLDLASGYHQIEVKEEDRDKTAFRTRYGSFNFKVMPFGLTNAPATFQRFMNFVLRDVQDVCAAGILDDILIFSKGTADEHKDCLRRVLTILKDHKLIAKIDKCELFKRSTNFWGHTVSDKGWQTAKEKVQTIREWPCPLPDVSAVRSFIGLCTYYRKFVKQFAKIAAPLHDLLRKGDDFRWEDKHTKSMEELKEALTSAPVLRPANVEKPFILRTDASGFALGAILAQKDEDGKEHPVAFESRKLRGAELNYPTHEKEMLAIIHALKVWRRYLQGTKVEIFTDHQTLQYFHKQKILTPKQVNWMSFISEFDYTIHYVKGEQNGAADACSRRTDLQDNAINTVTVTAPTEMLEYIKSVAKNDPEYQNLLSKGRSSSDELYFRGNRVVINDDILLVEAQHELKIFVPKAATEELIAEVHNSKYAGHLASDKTTAFLQQHFFWKGMKKQVDIAISQCRVCQASKTLTGKPQGQLQPLEVPPAPWHTIAMDFITSLPLNNSENDAVLVVTDLFSKMVHLFPCSETITAKQTANLIIDGVFKHHGMPVKIISDRDVRFNSSFWIQLWESMGTTLAKTSAFHPQSDGQTERANRTLIQMLRARVNNAATDWQSQLPFIEFAINNSLASATGLTPFQICYGSNPRTPVSMSEAPQLSPHDIAERIEHFRVTATENSNLEKKKMAKQINKKRGDAQFEVGQLVWLSTSNLKFRGQGRKLAPKFIGPFSITNKYSPVSYRLQLPEILKVHPTFHVSLLREYKSNEKEVPLVLPEQFLPVMDPDEQEVLKILDKRTQDVGGKLVVQYLIHWVGETAKEATWENVENLTNLRGAIRLFNRNFKTNK